MSDPQAFSSSAVSSSSASPANCEFGIKLQMSISKYNFENDPEHPQRPIRPTAWRMEIVVLEVNNLPPEIFVYNQGDLDPEEGTKRNWFQNVASPTDLIEYPVGAPLAGETPQFFRLASVDMVHRSLDVLDATWAAIKADVAELVEASARLCELEVKEVAVIGTFPMPEPEPVPEPESSSDSSSIVPEPCPDDDITMIEIQESTDPEFPAGTLLAPASGPDAECWRTWTMVSVGGYTLTLRTNARTHRVELSINTGTETVTDEEGLSFTYGAMLNYAYGSTQEHSIRITGS